MKKYLVTFQGNFNASELQGENLDQQLDTLEKWSEWADEFNDNIIDAGAPVLEQGVEVDVDGNDAPSRGIVSGYSVIQAENLKKAKGLVNKHPYFQGRESNAKVQIQEMVESES